MTSFLSKFTSFSPSSSISSVPRSHCTLRENPSLLSGNPNSLLCTYANPLSSKGIPFPIHQSPVYASSSAWVWLPLGSIILSCNYQSSPLGCLRPVVSRPVLSHNSTHPRRLCSIFLIETVSPSLFWQETCCFSTTHTMWFRRGHIIMLVVTSALNWRRIKYFLDLILWSLYDDLQSVNLIVIASEKQFSHGVQWAQGWVSTRMGFLFLPPLFCSLWSFPFLVSGSGRCISRARVSEHCCHSGR